MAIVRQDNLIVRTLGFTAVLEPSGKVMLSQGGTWLTDGKWALEDRSIRLVSPDKVPEDILSNLTEKLRAELEHRPQPAELEAPEEAAPDAVVTDEKAQPAVKPQA